MITCEDIGSLRGDILMAMNSKGEKNLTNDLDNKIGNPVNHKMRSKIESQISKMKYPYYKEGTL